MKNILVEQSKHSLIDCLKELKFGRTKTDQDTIDGFIDSFKESKNMTKESIAKIFHDEYYKLTPEQRKDGQLVHDMFNDAAEAIHTACEKEISELKDLNKEYKNWMVIAEQYIDNTDLISKYKELLKQ